MSEPSNANGSTPNGKTLEAWRREIDAVDTEILRLLSRRATIACELAAIKVASGLPAFDGRREQQVLDRVSAENPGPLHSESITRIFSSIIRETRQIGTESMEKQSSKKPRI